VTWASKFRPALQNTEIAPRPVQAQLPVWIGAGSPGSLAWAAALGYPAAIPMLGGSLPGFARLAAFYRQQWAQQQPSKPCQLAVVSHVHISATARQTREEFYPCYAAYLAPHLKGPLPHQAYADMLAPTGTLVAGSPEQVLDKLLQLQAMGVTRYMGQIAIGGQPFADVARQIELFATHVAPALR
jgi:alkanesulfonate monooxygenase SsuD/methylene tetrahydromethanopterin reductase-like flavin-dependent oxidoreductase (luciferase family)